MLFVLVLVTASFAAPVCPAATVTYNSSGCTTAGHYASTTAVSAADCCSQCAQNASCFGWTYHAGSGDCDLSEAPRFKAGVTNATCGCRLSDCKHPPAAACAPVQRPPRPSRVPLPPGISTPPHLISILVDDLGYDDTSLRGRADIDFTPQLQQLQEEGVRLDRHHTYLWCSPTRRSFLSGRYPGTSITGTQAPQCSNFLPLQFQILPEKLAAAGYESHFIGKGHLGWQTEDHLMVNRNFTSHVGYLGGGESYRWGGTYGSKENISDVTHFDMWHDLQPASRALLEQIAYSTNFYAMQAVQHIEARGTSQKEKKGQSTGGGGGGDRPMWLHMTFQAVHGGNWRQDVPAQDALASINSTARCLDRTYGSATRALDDAVGNITTALKRAGMWQTTLMLVTSDNGGDCGLPFQPATGVKGQPGSASNHPLLGRKCTAFEGGTRVAAFVSGGMIPAAVRGTMSTRLMSVADWYPTFCSLAGVDARDDWRDPATGITHGIDGVNLWPTLSAGDAAAPPLPRKWLPTTERSIIWDNTGASAGAGAGASTSTSTSTGTRTSTVAGVDVGVGMYKLVVNESQTNRFTANGSQYMDEHNPCLALTDNDEGAAAATAATAAISARQAAAASVDKGLYVPPSCAVCSERKPCLYDVLSDPLETKNLAQQMPDLAAALRAKLATFSSYVPPLSDANLACYNCTGLNAHSGNARWGAFWGPCCMRK